jgi:hypothetical protein
MLTGRVSRSSGRRELPASQRQIELLHHLIEQARSDEAAEMKVSLAGWDEIAVMGKKQGILTLSLGEVSAQTSK